MIVTLLKTIKSGHHNAPWSSELGEHWPAGQQFKVIPITARLAKFYPHLKGNFLVEQIGGEEVRCLFSPAQLPELFGLKIDGSSFI